MATEAIIVALRQRLARWRRQASAERRVDEMLVVASRCASRLEPGPGAAYHGEVLYDEHGLPNDERGLPK